MKIHQQLLALCVFHPWATTAFIGLQPKIKPSFTSLNSLNPRSISEGTARVEGQTRRTWKFPDMSKEAVQVDMVSGGRPMSADVQLWIGPDWSPMTMKIYSEDGRQFPVNTVVGTRNKAAEIELKNTGPYEFPFDGSCAYAPVDVRKELPQKMSPRYVEGGAIYTLPFDPSVEKVIVLLNTDARQLNARVEMMNGPNNIKQSYEIFTNNGLLNSLYIVFDTAIGGTTIRVKNLAPLEFPCKAYITGA